VRTCGVTLPISTRLEIDRAAVKWLTANTESCASIAIDFTATQLCCYDLLVYSLVHPIGVAKVQTQAYVYSSRDDTAATEPTAQPDLLPIARQLFVAGVSQSNAFIAEACTRGLQVCEIHAHARARPLYFQQRGSSVAAPVVMQGDEAAQELQGSQRVGTVPQASYLMASATQRQYESMFQQNPVGPEDTQQQQQQQAAAQTAEVAQAAQQPQHGMGAVSSEPEAVVDHVEPTVAVSHSDGDALPTLPASSLGADVAGTAASAPHVDTRLDHKRQRTAPESQLQVESLPRIVAEYGSRSRD
jgi:hypothetical protein